MADRASRRLFTGGILKPDAKSYAGDISQKILSASAFRYLLYWLWNCLHTLGGNDDESARLGFWTETFSELIRWRRAAVGALTAMETLQLESGRWMTSGATHAFEQAYLMFRASLNLLADRALAKKQLRYRFRPKLHQLGHLTYHWVVARGANPRHLSCYLDEDFVFKTQRLCVMASPKYVSQQVAMRYSMYLCLLYSGLVSRRSI